MDPKHPAGDEQAKLWNSSAGCAWVDAQAVTDRMFQPLDDLLVAAVDAASGGRVLDVGCGTGSTTLTIARRLGARGRATGIDISAPMVDAARERVQRAGATATFLCADAATYPFEPASIDAILSRFGVMFFEDPVGAFANLRRAAAEGAECRFIAWRSAAENPFMTAAERAAAPLLPDLPARRPDRPGQFAFADRSRVEGILATSGWTDIDIQPIDVTCTLAEADMTRYATRFGPVGQVFAGLAEPARTQIIQIVRAAFDPFVQGDEVRFTAACWMASARAT